MNAKKNKSSPVRFKRKTAGRKSYWDTRIKPRLKEIAHWCREGYTDKLICEALGITVATFCKYKLEKNELVKVLKVNKLIADLTVENSLYKRANGYEYKETVEEVKLDKEGNEVGKKTKTTRKQKSPDVTAQIFWLKNRTNEWTDRQTISHEGELKQTHEHEHSITVDDSPDNIAGVLGLLIESGAIKGKLIKVSEEQPRLIEVVNTTP